MRPRKAAIALLLAAILAGCRAHMISIRLVNTSAEPISTIITDYPSATFGKDRLAPGETFSSTVKITDSGQIKLQFTDAKGVIHRYSGLKLYPNQEGSIEIRLDQNSAVFTPGAAGR
jgi:hypothetical protein